MPRKNVPKASGAGRRPRRRAPYRRRGPRRARVSRGLTLPFPERFYCTHKFSNILHVDQATAGIPQVQSYRLNHLYDPNYTDSTGINNNQPLYYDQMAAIYYRYTVLSVRVVVKGALNSNGYYFMRPSNVIATPTDFILEMERPDSTHQFYSTGGNRLIMRKNCHINRIWGVKREAVIDGDEYSGTDSSTLPTNPTYLHIGFMNANTVGQATADYEVQFQFSVMWHKRKEISQS